MAAETYRIVLKTVVEDETGPGFESASRRVSAFDKVVEKAQSRLNKLTGSRWSATLNFVDKATTVLTNVESKIRSAAGKVWNFTLGVIDKATAPLQGVINLLKNPLIQAGAMIGVSLSVTDAVKTFSDFQSGMNEVFTLTPGISEAAMQNMEDELKGIAKRTGIDLQNTVSAAYQAVSAGVSTDNLSSFMDTASKAAIGGVTDLETAVDGLTSVINAYGKDVMSAETASDLMFTTVRLGKTTFGELADSLFNVVPTAVGAGVSFNDVSAALAGMTAQGVPTSVATTQLRQAIVELSKSGTETDKTFRSLAGKGFKDFIAEGGNIQQAFQLLEEHAKSTGLGINDMFSSVEAGNAVLALTGTGTEAFTNAMNEMASAAGATDAAYKTVDKGLGRFMAKVKSTFQVLETNFMGKFDSLFSDLADWFDENAPALESAMDEIATTIADKITEIRDTISEFTSSDEWANADVWGKIAIAWDKIVAEPFSQWWESSGKPWLTEKVAAFGETLGSGITAGLLAILGFDESGAIADGMTIGKSFLDGFKSGLDMDKISEAFTEWAGDHKGVIAAAGLVAGGKLLGGAAKAFQAAKGLFGGTSGGGGGGGLGSFVSTMTVSAGTVIVNGGMASNAANAVRTAAGGGGLPPLAGGTPALPGAAGGGRLALPGPAGGTAAAGGLTSAGSWLSKLLTVGSKSSVVGADGTLLAVQGGIGGALGSVGGALGSQATTAAGAAAAGGGAIAGGVMGGVGIISGLIDIFKGTQTSGKEAQDRYATGGTKIGMVGAGAAAGAGIGAFFGGVGAVPGALIGAGVGGIGAMLGGSKIGKMLSDSLDEGGLLNNAGKAIGGFFTETLPNFVTKSIPAAISSAGEAIGGFASSVGEIVGGFFTETIPTFLTEQVPYAVGYVVGAAQVFFTETVPGAVGDMLQTVGTFFTETVPAWAEGVAQRATTFFTETVPAAVGGLLQNVGNFFTETLPAWAEGVGQRAAVFFGETVPTFVGELFTNVGTFFTETIPEWATGAFEAAATFFTEDVPRFIGDLWDNVTGFVTETIPAWGKSIGDKVSGWWDSISGWFSDLWDGISGAFSSGKSAGAEAAGGKHAEGGIMHAPHMAQVAEDGPEAIIPLGASSRSRGMAVWEQAGDILGANTPAPVGSNDNGLGDIIPEGNGGAWSAPQDGESGNDAPVYTTATPGTTGPAGGQGEPAVTVPVNITINPEIVIQAAAQGMSPEDIVALLKEHIRAMVDDISDEMAEKLARIFANMPVRGGA